MAFIAILASTIAQALLKHGMDRVGGFAFPNGQLLVSMQKVFTEPFVISGFLLVILAVPLWLQVLSRLPLSAAYPLVSLGYVVSLGIGAFIFKENVTLLRVAGVGLILLGVIAVSRS